ncbi:glycosyltransferase family 2 protein [Flavobacterium sp. MR2016-29]|uniref:glycosyltransferase family 2 protein n=1 Tax=Flavobacterium sp. MR2016-29 TaxID=2783795 RepID=UPI00188BD971|nr:glycosyltransferase family 2 protein [Flavobacterium sp. MR2016-29]MBF4492905.1 glycosyltransferase family 2 protein [Flavobacterium sp. MR2016-29]
MRIEDKLEIVIITYNRCKLLDNTLVQFLGSPFVNCKITILDNCSTDDTVAVCSNYLKKFSNFHIISNKFNIGANANILRAVETVNSDFIWIVCDDDNYDFSYCDDVIDCILNNKVNIINLGAHPQDEWRFGGQLKNAKDLLDDGYPFFKAASFVPNNLFRVSEFLPYNISGYNNIINMYPHMPYLLSNFSQNNSVYISKNRIVTAGIGEQIYNSKDWIEGWMNTSYLLNKKRDIKKCFYSQLNIGFFNEIKSCLIILFGAINGTMYYKTVFRAFSLLSFFQKIIFIMLVIPYIFYRFFNKILK